jgi:hypothetical protein
MGIQGMAGRWLGRRVPAPSGPMWHVRRFSTRDHLRPAGEAVLSLLLEHRFWYNDPDKNPTLSWT